MSFLAKQIMVVDDEPDLLMVLTTMLESKGYRVHGFIDPIKASTHVKDCKDCGILISDIRMPTINGFQLVRAVKKVRPDMKVVLMTAFEIHEKEWQKTLPSTEVDHFLTKPFDSATLVEAIEKCSALVH